MNTAMLLLTYAVVLGAVAPAMLQRASWVERAPRLAMAAWRSLTVAVPGAALLAGLTMVVPASPLGAPLARALDACVMMMQDSYATPQRVLIIMVALLLSVAIITRVAYGVGVELGRAWWERRRHMAVLRMVARRDVRLDVLVVHHRAAIAYCLPGRGGSIVLSSSALSALGDRRLAAVLAHERAHLRGRHHLLTATARGLRRAFPLITLFATAEREIDRLAELAADDAAVHASDRLTVADALLTLADDHVLPGPALGTTPHDTGQRVRRLLKRTPPLHPVVTLVIALLAWTAMAAPLVAAAMPAVATIGVDCCPTR
ncbi:M56 family metallopeptidase [Nonomuraea rhodomycinica]|uniref:M56 family metallopeptidase n=1 Tax=Nonomuraea rhodomycinica TaxID=1712872 RepID=A0A7Y6IJT8_9ACTN|nr:M56 family metallopeptidase [Nonomuraea rhodomycinica]NUW39525.1 M56 family metallopeptidase [Nonomuraea rhodomycinica]